jgi:hypothetical protein
MVESDKHDRRDHMDTQQLSLRQWAKYLLLGSLAAIFLSALAGYIAPPPPLENPFYAEDWRSLIASLAAAAIVCGIGWFFVPKKSEVEEVLSQGFIVGWGIWIFTHIKLI